MAETVKFIRAATMAAFESALETISNTSIVFIEDEQKIWTHGVFYDHSSINSEELQKIYDAIDNKQDAGDYITLEQATEVYVSNGIEPTNENILIWVDESEGESVDFLSKSYADTLYQPIGDYITEIPSNLVTEEELSEKNYTVTKVFENVTVSNWSEDSTYSEYPYVSIIAIDYVLSTDLGEVYFNVDEALSCNYAPVCDTIDGGIKIWSKVNNQIIIPTIKIIKYGNN